MQIIKLSKTNHQGIISKAIEALKKGGIIIYPTETCYGVGVDATNSEAVKKLLTYKERPTGKAISIAVSDEQMAQKYVKVNGDDNFDLNAVDSVTKFVLAHSFVVVRTKKACIEFLSQIKINCYNQILSKYYIRKYSKGKKKRLVIFVCDKFANYKTAFNKLFYRVAELQFGVSIACKKYGRKYNNNAIERYNREIKRRVIVFGSFRSFEVARVFLSQVYRSTSKKELQLAF